MSTDAAARSARTKAQVTMEHSAPTSSPPSRSNPPSHPGSPPHSTPPQSSPPHSVAPRSGPLSTGSPETSRIRKETVAIRDGLKVVRLVVPAGARVPEHHSSVVVVATILRGSGMFTIAGRPRTVTAGDVVDLAPGVHHAIQAEEELEVVVVHARIGLPPAVTA